MEEIKAKIIELLDKLNESDLKFLLRFIRNMIQ